MTKVSGTKMIPNPFCIVVPRVRVKVFRLPMMTEFIVDVSIDAGLFVADTPPKARSWGGGRRGSRLSAS
jgi:hypothetical protein